MTDEDKQLAERVTEGFLQQVRNTIEKVGQAEGQLIVQQTLLAYVWRPMQGEDLPADSPFAGLTPGQREAVAKAATDVLAMIQAELRRPT